MGCYFIVPKNTMPLSRIASECQITQQIICTLKIKDGVPWPKIYGGGVEVETGEVFTAQVFLLHSKSGQNK